MGFPDTDAVFALCGFGWGCIAIVEGTQHIGAGDAKVSTKAALTLAANLALGMKLMMCGENTDSTAGVHQNLPVR